jgi:hypothetical protein
MKVSTQIQFQVQANSGTMKTIYSAFRCSFLSDYQTFCLPYYEIPTANANDPGKNLFIRVPEFILRTPEEERQESL